MVPWCDPHGSSDCPGVVPGERGVMAKARARSGGKTLTGDPTQLDLPRGQPSGLLHARKVLGEVEGMAWIELGSSDIVRNRLVTRIVDAYERSEDDS